MAGPSDVPGRKRASAQKLADAHSAPAFRLNLEDLKNHVVAGGDGEHIAVCLDNCAGSRVRATVR